jgi:hypothetical protein
MQIKRPVLFILPDMIYTYSMAFLAKAAGAANRLGVPKETRAQAL